MTQRRRDGERPLPKAVRFQMRAARRLGLDSRVLDPEYGHLFEIGDGNGRRLLIGGRSPLNDSVAARVAGDKYYTKVVLAELGLRVPRAARCLAPGYFEGPRLAERAGPEPGVEFAAAHGYPLIVKPNRKSHGRQVCEVGSDEELLAAIERVWAIDYIALVEEKALGNDYRLDFLDGDFLLGYERRPVTVVGDGRSTLRELLAERDPRTRQEEFWAGVGSDPVWRRRVARRGLEAGSVLGRGVELELGSAVLNLHRWATAELIPELPPVTADLCRAIGEALHLRLYGIDLKAPRLDAGAAETVVIEVNSSPLLTGMAEMGYEEEALAAQAKVLRAAWETVTGAPAP